MFSLGEKFVRQPQHVADRVFATNFRASSWSRGGRANSRSVCVVRIRNTCLDSAGAILDVTGLDRLSPLTPTRAAFEPKPGSPYPTCFIVVPHGWFLPTTPGTRFVTLGGAWQTTSTVKTTTGPGPSAPASSTRAPARRRPPPQPDLRTGAGTFGATIGGLGLTGVIEWVELQLARSEAPISTSKFALRQPRRVLVVAEESVGARAHRRLDRLPVTRIARGAAYSPARIGPTTDGFTPGRSRSKACRSISGFALNRLSVAAFNALYIASIAKSGRSGSIMRHFSIPSTQS